VKPSSANRARFEAVSSCFRGPIEAQLSFEVILRDNPKSYVLLTSFCRPWSESSMILCLRHHIQQKMEKQSRTLRAKETSPHTHTQKYTTNMQIGICPFVDFGLQIIPSSCHGLRVLPAIAAAPGKLHNGKASRRCVGQNVCIIYCGNVRISCLRWF